MMCGFSFILVAWLLNTSSFLQVIVEGETKGLGSDDEVRLVRDLFERGYNPLIRPVKNISESIEVQFNLALSQLISVDEKNQVMKTNVWLQMYWNDYQLQWNPKDYGNINTIRIAHNKAWRPDIVLFNNADGKYEPRYLPNFVLEMNGELTYNIYQIPVAIYKSSCEIDVKYFPFDEQICEMKFGSWTFQAGQLDFWYIKFNGLDLTDYLKSGTWDLVDCPSRIETCIDKNTNQSKSLYIASFHIRRKTLFYTVNLIIPCILISFVSVSVFIIPPDSCEKITLIISILLALVVFLLLISKMLPPSMTIPLIAKYLMFDFLMNIIAVGSTVFIINRNYRTARTHQMPNWVRLVFLNYLPRMLLMKRPNHEERGTKSPTDISEMHASRSSLNLNCIKTNQIMTNKHDTRDDAIEVVLYGGLRHIDTMVTARPVNNSPENSPINFKMTSEMREASEAISFMRRHLEWEDRFETVQTDWKYVAMVIDRMLLYIFLIVTISGTLGIVFQSPFILQYVDQDAVIENLKAKYNLTSNGYPTTSIPVKYSPC